MPYQRGSLKKVFRKEGQTWVLRYRITNASGRRVEHTLPVGLIEKFPKHSDAWREVDRLGLGIRINDASSSGCVCFQVLAEHYLKADFGSDAVRPKSANTIPIVEHYVRDYLVERFGKEIAENIKPLDIQKWLKSLHDANKLAWTTVSKIRGIMHRIYKVGELHELVAKNPVAHVETRSKTNYRAVIVTPAQTLAILKSLPFRLHFALVLTCAATALRSSEILALRWSDMLWGEGRIRVSKRWAKGEDGDTKTEASDGYVPMHPLLAGYLRDWQRLTPYGRDSNFVFPSIRSDGRKPLYASSFVADYLRPAAKAAGVGIEDGQRFGLHNLRHSLSNWLVNKAKIEPKTVQGILRHSKIQTTLDLYTQEDSDETRAAQGEFLNALGMSSAVN
ncbi:MAG TPA: site-specific integrase [Terriglobales bacterium]|nr:site-specific integrase [Terriglobales bacterium]